MDYKERELLLKLYIEIGVIAITIFELYNLKHENDHFPLFFFILMIFIFTILLIRDRTKYLKIKKKTKKYINGEYRRNK
jgi:hypothetical protein